ncbi:Rrf2 family transcriptional regulator [Candidatus Poribacteria bacterium]|nr:Rrf2 family transcriptional regulator [Candidatus Poribacteria bacterium]
MKLSRKSDYALRAVLHLASSPGGVPIPVREVAERNAIPRKFLEAIMRDLKDLGLVESVAGKKGGYMLTRPPGMIRVGEVLRHFDGHLENREGEPGENSNGEPAEIVQRVLRDLGIEVDRLMNETTLETVLRGLPLNRSNGYDTGYSLGEGI